MVESTAPSTDSPCLFPLAGSDGTLISIQPFFTKSVTRANFESSNLSRDVPGTRISLDLIEKKVEFNFPRIGEHVNESCNTIEFDVRLETDPTNDYKFQFTWIRSALFEKIFNLKKNDLKFSHDENNLSTILFLSSFFFLLSFFFFFL